MGSYLYAVRNIFRHLHKFAAFMLVAPLLLYGCTSIIEVPDRPLKAALQKEGYGTAIGSVLFSIPTDVTDIDVQKYYESLKSARYEMTIRRYIAHEYGFASRTEYTGDKFRITFDPDVTHNFVINAPAGTYTTLTIEPTGFLKPNMCLEFPAGLRIHAAKTTYVGQLTIVPRFVTYDEMKKNIRNNFWKTIEIGTRTQPKPLFGEYKGFLEVEMSVVDKKEQILLDLGMEKLGTPMGLDTQLMWSKGKSSIFECNLPPVPQPPR